MGRLSKATAQDSERRQIVQCDSFRCIFLKIRRNSLKRAGKIPKYPRKTLEIPRPRRKSLSQSPKTAPHPTLESRIAFLPRSPQELGQAQ